MAHPGTERSGDAYPDLYGDKLDPYKAGMSALRESEQGMGDEHELDNPENKSLLTQLEDWWYQARIVQSDNRQEMYLDDDYYDGLQWSEEDRKIIEERGQAANVFNHVKQNVDWIIGVELQSKMDFMVHPRSDEDRAAAQVKRELIKYVDHVNKGSYARSMAFQDAVRVGVGWIETGIRSDHYDEPLFIRYENWRNMWYDHLDPSRDMSESRYCFRSKWIDLDVACKMFPERKHKLQGSARRNDLYSYQDDDEFYLSQLYFRTDSQGRPLNRRTLTYDSEYAFQNRRERVRLVEAWYRMPTRGDYLYIEDPRYIRFNGQLKDDKNDFHKWMMKNNYASAYDAVRMKVFQTIFVEGALLKAPTSPYNHDRFPFTPIWGYRRARDNAPYGVIRNMRDPQDDLNKRRSKAIHILSTNRVIMEEGAVDDEEELREEAAAPDGLIKHKRNYALSIENDNAMAKEHVMLEQMDRQYIQDAAGVTAENLGEATNAISGRAIQARQSQGSMTTAELFNNLAFSHQYTGENTLSLIEQFYDRAKEFRIIGPKNMIRFERINQMVGYNEQGQPVVENPITQTQADFVISRVEWRETVRLAIFEQMMTLLGQMDPQIALQMLDMVVEMSDVPEKDAFVKRIRQINGQTDPNAMDTPEGQAEMAARQKKQEEDEAMQAAATMAQLQELLAKAKETEANSLVKVVEAMKKASEIGSTIEEGSRIQLIIDALMEMANSELDNMSLEAPQEQPPCMEIRRLLKPYRKTWEQYNERDHTRKRWRTDGQPEPVSRRTGSNR